jgi:hypothetical protein
MRVLPRESRQAWAAFVALFAMAVLIAAGLAGCGCDGGKTTDDGTTPDGDTVKITTPEDESIQTSPGSTGPKIDEETTPDETSEDAEESATEAAMEMARKNNPELGDFEVLGVVMADGWARVDMQPVSGSTDAASWLLRKENGEWVLLDFGTSIIPGDYPDAPPEVFQTANPE